MKTPSFSWQLKATVDGSPLGSAVYAALEQTSELFCASFSDVSVTPNSIVSFSTGYTIWWSTSHQFNEIHRVDCSGAGEIAFNHGPLPILFLARLKQLIVKKRSDEPNLLRFCSEIGAPVSLDTWKDVKSELSRMGFDYQVIDVVYEYAKRIGFILKLFDESVPAENDFSYF